MRVFFVIVLACVFGLTFAVPASARGTVLILDYHTFLGHGPSQMDYSLEEFAQHLDRIEALGFHFVALADALSGNLEGDRNIALTIDDGHQSVYAAVLQVVIPRKIPVQLFVFPGPINRSVHYLKLAKLQELLDAGVAMGAHGYFHNYMSPTAWSKNPTSVLFEAQKPANELLRMTGEKPTFFAYPFGVAAPEAIDAVKGQGYEWAFLANGAITPVDPTDPALNHWVVPRTIVYRSGLKKLFAYLTALAGVTTPSVR